MLIACELFEGEFASQVVQKRFVDDEYLFECTIGDTAFTLQQRDHR